jgi:integrase
MSTFAPPARVPRLCRHRASGQAVVRLDGRDFYCGLWRSRAAQVEYDRLIAIYLASSRRMPPPDGAPGSPTITELVLDYFGHVEVHHRRADGTQTSEVRNNRIALRTLRRLYGRTQAHAFGPLALKAVRQDFIGQDLSRTTVNSHVGRIKRMFRWAVENERVPPTVLHGLQAVRGLQRGRSEARDTDPVQPVTDGHVEAVLPHLSPPVAAVVRLMHLTGMRVGETVAMRTGDLDMGGRVWEYRPAAHKMAYKGRERIIPLGPRAQEIIRPLLRAAPDAPIFCPAEAEAARQAERRAHRQTPMTPSQAARRPKRQPKRAPGHQYTADVVRRAIRRGCEDAGIPLWSPHQLRHAAATRLRKEFGIEAAQLVLGHESAAITLVYAERDRARAADIMGKVG